MRYKIDGGFSDTQDNTYEFRDKYNVADSGPYIGIVKSTIDPLKMGRLGVHIPALSKTAGTKEQVKAESVIWCQYLSPFYGAKPAESLSKDPYNGPQQTSYGMWAVPPDIDTNVLVMFAKGEKGQANAFWIGCIQEPLVNQQVPGLGSSTNSKMDEKGGGPAAAGDRREQNYNTTLLPVMEKNKRVLEDGESLEGLNNWRLPVNEDLAEQLLTQGLIADPVRGTTTSSARRETPSAVFGMNTPGRIKPDSRTLNIGLEGAPIQVDRAPGHSFVMDDGDAAGNNQLTRLRTASGHQILMHDTEGSIYIANGSGNAYIEMKQDGRIDVYSGIGGINFRTEGDFNFHADNNINFHANGQIRMNSEQELMQSGKHIVQVGEEGFFASAPKGAVRHYGRDGISSYSDGTQLHGAAGQIHLAGAQVHFNSVGASTSWGPVWATREKLGLDARDEGDVELAQKGIKPLEEFSRQTKTTVHRFVTHEPMFRARTFVNDGVIPVESDDKKQWSRLSRTPGTPEFRNNLNRLSDNEAIRNAQFQADAQQWLKSKMGTSTDVAQAKSLLTDFGLKYNEIYGIAGKQNLPFDLKDSISEKIQNFNVKNIADNVTSKLTSQVIDNFSNATNDLFKDNVFVNSAGELFTLANSRIKGVSDELSAINREVNSVKGLVNNISTKNVVGTVANLNSITQTYSQVVGGKVVNTAVQNFAAKGIKNFATKSGLFNAREAAIGGQSFLQNVGANLGSKIATGIKSVGSFFSGFKFSDRRLKEDIRLIGKSPSGVNIYSFKYYQIPGRYIGVMAQEVPWARHMTDYGYYAVDYNKVDVEFRRLN